MNHQYYNVIGVMSGTSLDGIDIARIELVRTDSWNFQICERKCVSYSSQWHDRLKDITLLDPDKIHMVNQQYTELLAQCINDFIIEHQLTNILAICSHGHTATHDPVNGHTLQIGNLSQLARLVNHRVVCDFRVQDVTMGGQGAPLVPIGDRLLFNEYDYCLNLGGFANLSYEQDDRRIAYDICAVNVVLNHYARQLGREYDDDGAFAKAGTPHTPTLEKLNALPFYTLQAPKSLGIEWVNENVFPILQKLTDTKDALATYCAHIAIQISKNIKAGSKVLVTGGGAFNTYLIQLAANKSNVNYHIPDEKLINYKEALIFALLGVLRLRNENNVLASVTGAKRDHCSGMIYLP
ncbi:anhydro-N-acetylmuramic acid kinase [Nonlabens ponticola]|uniref:Anhydro-N-acetylmuramic acid kinase n=1 Tax=Nonlabens ponticola TaxID=2496866 RepID=A0A3S9MU91_9FLAO|nr:anhydro-N-acetylmuramic acid kinase [Nonlabens ponticola]AZQ42749.1 anhydro-N-acetylmuramic acid kinase [Nonlabens ponticola]